MRIMIEVYRRLGRGFCLFRGGKLDCYLLSEEEVDAARKILTLLEDLPEGFRIATFNVGVRMCVYKAGDAFLIFPVHSENVIELERRLEGIEDVLHR